MRNTYSLVFCFFQSINLTIRSPFLLEVTNINRMHLAGIDIKLYPRLWSVSFQINLLCKVIKAPPAADEAKYIK